MNRFIYRIYASFQAFKLHLGICPLAFTQNENNYKSSLLSFVQSKVNRTVCTNKSFKDVLRSQNKFNCHVDKIIAVRYINDISNVLSWSTVS